MRSRRYSIVAFFDLISPAFGDDLPTSTVVCGTGSVRNFGLLSLLRFSLVYNKLQLFPFIWSKVTLLAVFSF